MPNPPNKQPRTYGTPIGATGGKPINTGRTQAGPAPAGQISEYLKHMIGADSAYHAKQGAAPARGSSGGLSNMLAKGKPPVGVGGRRREAAIMDTVDKAAR